MLRIVEDHPIGVFILALWLLGLLTAVTVFKIWKIRRMMQLDKEYKAYKDGNLVTDGRSRNVWDYNFFPGMSKAWHMSEWQPLLAVAILLLLILVYVFTNEEKVLGFLGVNLGVILGMMLNRNQGNN